MGKRVPQRQKDQFARELKLWRERKRFTQAEAAEFLGLPSVRTLQDWEVGRTRPVGVALALICNLIRNVSDLDTAGQPTRLVERCAPGNPSPPLEG